MSGQKKPQLSAWLAKNAAKCVKCGLCSAVCPSYQVTKQEPFSPRGRLAVMHALAEDQLEHQEIPPALDACLGCRSCEAMCPAQVPYGPIFDVAQNILSRPPQSLLAKLQFSGIKALVKLAQHRLWHYPLYQMLRWTAKLQPLLRLDKTQYRLPKLGKYRKTEAITGATKKNHGRVLILTGCISRVFEREALADAITLLSKLGYQVTVPQQGHCCGAIALHQGDAKAAQRAATAVTEMVQPLDYDHITMLSSGCLSTLKEYAKHPLLAELPESTRTLLQPKLIDLFELLEQAFTEQAWTFNAYPGDLTLHVPCSYRNNIGKVDTIAKLLARVPELKLHHVPTTSSCCGAAGTYFLRHQDTAEQLKQPIVDTFSATKSKKLLTCNVGCALHLQNSEIAHNISHPITVLLESSKTAT